MKFNPEFALAAITTCLSTILVGLLIQALAKYVNRTGLVDILLLASLFVAIVVGFFVKGK